MIGFVGIGTISGGSGSLVLDAGYITERIANLLRRSDLDNEILHWISFVQRDLTKKIRFPGLRAGVETLLEPNEQFYDLPLDYSLPDRVYYMNTTDPANVWGRNLVPLPRKFYAGDVVDLERLVNVTVPSNGDPYYYWLDGATLGVYPVLADDGRTAKIQFWYYKASTDIILSTDLLSIPDKYRSDMIWLVYFWGMAALEKEDITKVAYWKRMYKETLKEATKDTRASETARESTDSIPSDMSRADGVY